jgi:ferredoxin--NADP+ reductase
VTAVEPIPASRAAGPETNDQETRPVNVLAETAPAVDAFTPDAQEVLSVKHWDDRLFSFRTTRPQSLRFRSGEFVMIGLIGANGKPLLRAYSIASPMWDESLEFYSIKVPNGPLTSRLQNINPGDFVIVKPKPVGTLVLDALIPGKRLWMISTGTGVAPFASLMRDPETYEKFEKVILTQTCRKVSELQYGETLASELMEDPLVGEEAAGKFIRYATTTREESPKMGRITDLIDSGRLFEELGLPAFDPAEDRVMICGSMGLNLDVKALLAKAGLNEGANSRPAEFVLEKAFVG